MSDRRKDTRRVNDATVLLLAENLAHLKEEFVKKFDNGITAKIEEITKTLLTLPCKVHWAILENIKKTTDLELMNLKKYDLKRIDRQTGRLQYAIFAILICIIGLIFKK